MKLVTLALALALFSTAADATTISVKGDSIAVGTSWALKLGPLKNEVHNSVVDAKVGAACTRIAQWPLHQTDVLVLSVGSNQEGARPNTKLRQCLATLAPSLSAFKRAIVILPALPKHAAANAVVRAWALNLKSPSVSFVQNTATVDGTHPRYYGTIARKVMAIVSGMKAGPTSPSK